MRKPAGISRKNWNAFCNWYKAELRIDPKRIDRIEKQALTAFKGGWNQGFLEGNRQKHRTVD